MYGQIIKLDIKDNDERPKSINEVIRELGGDTVEFFYNDRYQMVKPNCATKFRISKVDPTLAFFTGDFIDYYLDSTIALEGNYTNGKKEGIFKFYFPNGQLEKIGEYSGDKKNGIWEYYYEDGTQHQIFEFRQKEILAKSFWNEKGKQLVNLGNGEWFGYETTEKFQKIKGHILNGKKDGYWIRYIPSSDFTVNEENYKEGQFLGGVFNSMFNGSKSYIDTAYCTLEQPLSFLKAEIFEINQCYPAFKSRWEFAKYPGGIEKLNKEIKEKLVLKDSTRVYGNIRIKLTIDSEGKMTNFKALTNLGYENEIINILPTLHKWEPTKVEGKVVAQTKLINYEIR